MPNEQDSFDTIEPLPSEFEALQQRLLADGAHWRASLPSTERLEARLNGLARQERAASQPSAESTELLGRLRLVTPPKGEPPVFQKRIKLITASVAIAAVVALFAVLFYGFTGHHTQTGAPVKVQTATPFHPTPGPGGTTGQSDNSWATPAIAPSDPQVVYQLAQANASAKLTLQRSTDGGKTWKTFAVPAGSSSDDFKPSIVVNPLNAQFVYLTVGGTRSGSDCAVTHALKNESSFSGGQNICDVQYLSTDGGVTWSVLHLPLPSALGDTSGFGWPLGLTSNSLTVFKVQGTRLYSTLGPYVENGAVLAATAARLVTSTDGGLTWQLIDAGLGDGNGVCDYAPDPASATIFAITTVNCTSPGVGPLILWRSDTAGSSWTQVGQLANNTELGMIVGSQGAGKQPLLYNTTAQETGGGALAADVSRPQSGGGGIDFSPANLQVSADGGKTWQAAPSKGFPDAKQTPGKPLGVTSNGFVLFFVQNHFYTWKLGESAWSPLPQDGEQIVSGNLNYAFLTAPGADRKQTLCIVSDTGPKEFHIAFFTIIPTD
jgi:hypothetical protein